MFVDIEDTRMLWFNPQSFEVDHNYKLIGMLLGLAVYNNIILDIRFPTVGSADRNVASSMIHFNWAA